MNDVVNSGMRNFWNNAGGRMWVDYQRIIETSMEPFSQKLMDVLNITEGERVLDIGCGCGDTTTKIAQRVGDNVDVVGVDISEIIIAAAKKNVAIKSLCNIRFECVDAQTHKFEDGYFNVIFSRLGVMFFEDPIAAFKNIKKSLVSGGRMAFICWQPVKKIEWISVPLEVVDNYVSLPESSPSDEPGGFSFGDASRVMNILNAAGYVDIVIERFNIDINIGSDIDDAIAYLTHIGPAGTVLNNSDIDSETQARFTKELGLTLESFKTCHGVEIGAATWIVTARNP